MSLGEPARHNLHAKLEDVLGVEQASTLMQHLPPFPWDELVTRQELGEPFRALERRLDAKLEVLGEKIEKTAHCLKTEFVSGLNSQLRWILLPIAVLLAGLVEVVLRLGFLGN